MNGEQDRAEEALTEALADFDDALAAGLDGEGQAATLSGSCREEARRGLDDLRLVRGLLARPRPAPPAAGLPWARLGRFEVRRELGRGGCGIVYLAFDPVLGREVALKVPRAEVAVTPELRQRFHREARATAGLDHPNLVPVYEAGEVGPVCYLVSAYCPGATLTQWLKERADPVPFRLAAALVATLADALEHAHARGVVHRDLKPANVMVAPGGGPDGLPFVPRVTDFGLAKLLLEGAAGQTRTGAILGTVSYMAPEQAMGKAGQASPTADVYSLGVILYELLTGRVPFQGEADLATLQQVQSAEPVPPGRLRLGLPRDLETVCLKCLRKEPARRYATARELADDLLAFQDGRPIRARPVGRAERLRRWCRREPLVASLLGVVAGLLLLLTAGATYMAFAEHRLATEAGLARVAAEESGERERAQRQRAEELLERQYVANAVRLIDKDDLPASLPWLVEGMRLARGDPDRERPHRLRLAAVMHHCPRPLHVWFHDREVSQATFSPDGRRALTADWDGTVCVREAVTGELVSRMRHGSSLYRAAFSPDGRRVVTAGGDCTARFWEADTGRQVGQLLGHTNAVVWAEFSPDGARVVTASHDKTAQVWDAAACRPVGRALRHDGFVVRAAFCGKGKRVVTASHDGTARVWDAATGELDGGLTLDHRWGQVWAAAFSADGARVLTAGFGGAMVWDLLPGKRSSHLLKHSNSVREAVFSRDGSKVLTAGIDGTAGVWQTDTGAQLLRLEHPASVSEVAFRPDGKQIVTACDDGAARVWDAETGQPDGPPMQHSGRVYGARFSPCGRQVLTACFDDTARLWSLEPRPPPTPPLKHGGIVWQASFRPDGRFLVTASRDKTAQVWDAATGAMVGRPLQHEGEVVVAAFGPGGGRVLTASHDGTAQVWEAKTGRRVGKPLRHPKEVLHAAFSPDGERVVTASQDGTARVWHAETGAAIGPPMGHPSEVLGAALSPDGRVVLTTCIDSAARLWEADTGRELGHLIHGLSRVNSPAFSPDGRRALTAGRDDARVWDWGSRELVGEPMRHHGGVRHAAFSPDGRRVVTASADRTARVWDAATGKPACPPMPHQGDVVWAAFSPDGRNVCTACSTSTEARVWDAATGEPLTPVLRHPDGVWRAEFSPDGRRLVTAGLDGYARVWELPFESRPLEELVRLAEALSGKQILGPGTFVPLAKGEFRRRWADLSARYPRDLFVPAITPGGE